MLVKPWTQHFEFPLPALQRFHIVLEARDRGTPALTRYRRVLLDIATDGRTVNGKACPKIARMPEPKEVHFATGKVETGGAVYSSADSTIGELLENPATLAILQKLLPEIATQAARTPASQGMTLRAIRGFVPGLDDAKLAEIDAELAKVPGP